MNRIPILLLRAAACVAFLPPYAQADASPGVEFAGLGFRKMYVGKDSERQVKCTNSVVAGDKYRQKIYTLGFNLDTTGSSKPRTP